MRINFFGGPGSGKSTSATRVFSELKELGHSVEIVTEFVKSWAYSGREPQGFDQIYLFGKQSHYEHRFLSSGVKNIVTDSPLLLSCVYAEKFCGEFSEHLLGLEREIEKTHPSLNIFLERGGKSFDPSGRFQSIGEAKEIDGLTVRLLQREMRNYHVIPFTNKKEILDLVLKHVES